MPLDQRVAHELHQLRDVEPGSVQGLRGQHAHRLHGRDLAQKPLRPSEELAGILAVG